MSRMSRRIMILIGVSAVLASGAPAQRLSALSFVFARYATGSATAL